MPILKRIFCTECCWPRRTRTKGSQGLTYLRNNWMGPFNLALLSSPLSMHPGLLSHRYIGLSERQVKPFLHLPSVSNVIIVSQWPSNQTQLGRNRKDLEDYSSVKWQYYHISTFKTILIKFTSESYQVSLFSLKTKNWVWIWKKWFFYKTLLKCTITSVAIRNEKLRQKSTKWQGFTFLKWWI